MARMTETALKGRARVLLEAMTERSRWIYALPRLEGPAAVRAVMAAHDLVTKDGEAGTERYESRDGKASIVLFDSELLDVALIEAASAEAAPVLGEILERTGFYAQSTLLRTALDTHDPEASTALCTLAHMVLVWDEGWRDLFSRHLADSEAVVRQDAIVGLKVAARVANDAGPALELLAEAMGREKIPELKETMSQALDVVRQATGSPVQATLEALRAPSA